jgi:oligopeptide transport system ATP-binding protein
MPVLEIRNLKTHFFISNGVIKAVDGVDITIQKGETLGIVGESGCGKTVLALSIMRLIPDPPGKIVSGSIQFKNRDLLKLSLKEMQQIRGNEMSMIFQEPMTSLNPVYTIGEQISETIRMHQRLNRTEAKKKAIGILDLVGIPDSAKRYNEYPHKMSGGMRQRVMIAMALCCNPDLLIADEPTTALDVTIQAQILELIEALKDELKMSVIMVTHDLGVIAETAQKAAVMYAGHIVEESPVKDLFHNPLPPYTIGLFRSLPRVDAEKDSHGRLMAIQGSVPDLLDLPPGCPFQPRCEWAKERCKEEIPPYRTLTPHHSVGCWEAKA